MPTPEQRFWDKVDRSGGPDACWPWLGYRKKSGHGLTSYKSMPIHAHRKAWILTHGPISSEISINHRCDNPPCCNPSARHMYEGTRADNMIDRWLKTPPDARMANGRTRVLTDEQIERLWNMRREGTTLKTCAAEFGVHIATICRYITAQRKVKLAKNRADRMARLSQ